MTGFLLWLLTTAIGVGGVMADDFRDEPVIRVLALLVFTVAQVVLAMDVCAYNYEKAFCANQGGTYTSRDICLVDGVYKEPLFTFVREKEDDR
jgi:hypothetical protein